jgi:XTP/dITP diphosphohydrolase
MIHDLYYATSRTRKFEEVKEFTLAYDLKIRLNRVEIDIDEIQSLDQRAVALAKAKTAWNFVKKPVLIDDEGVFFEAYPLFPGTFSKYIAEALGYEGIFTLTACNNKASFNLTMVYMNGTEDLHVFEGKKEGTIVRPALDRADFSSSLTEIFKPQGSSKTYAELKGIKELENFSPRIIAFKKFLMWYQQHCG